MNEFGRGRSVDVTSKGRIPTDRRENAERKKMKRKRKCEIKGKTPTGREKEDDAIVSTIAGARCGLVKLQNRFGWFCFVQIQSSPLFP